MFHFLSNEGLAYGCVSNRGPVNGKRGVKRGS